MKSYIVNYFFDGRGSVRLLAKSKKDAEKMFDEGQFNDEDDMDKSENYCIDSIEEA
jgi:hypothetical protein